MEPTRQNKKVLITGASGFIGSFLVEEALSQGYDVYAGIRKTSNLEFLPKDKIQFVEFDFSSPAQIETRLKEIAGSEQKFDFVIHNAGITYAKRKKDFYSVNFQNTKNLVDVLNGTATTISKFIFISSLAVYGPGDSFFKPIAIDHEKQPISNYGKSKLLAEEYIRLQKDLPWLIINPTAVYGPRDKDFLRFFSLIKSGFELHVGRYKQMISLIYVKDLARAIVSLLESNVSNRSYLVSDQTDYSKTDFADIAKTVLQKRTMKFRLPVLPVKLAVLLNDQIYHLRKSNPFLNKEKFDEMTRENWLCDSHEIWKQINDQPLYNLEAGVKETIDWYQKNKWI